MDSWVWYQRSVLPMQSDLRSEFAQVFLNSLMFRIHCATSLSYAHQRGHTSPAEALVSAYRGTPCIGAAIQAQIVGMSYAAAAEAHGRKASSFRKHMKRAARLLDAAYA